MDVTIRADGARKVRAPPCLGVPVLLILLNWIYALHMRSGETSDF